MTQDAHGSHAVVEEIVFDGRGLQRLAHAPARRAEHDLALLLALRHRPWPHGRPRLVGLVDHAAEPLGEHHRLLFDEVTGNRRRIGRRPRWFVSATPMDQDPVWASPILLDPDVLKLAVLREPPMIGAPGGRPSSLGRQAERLTCFAWLGRYDLFAVASAEVQADLARARSVDASRIFVAGRPVRNDPRRRADAAVPLADRRHVVVVVDGDPPEELKSVVWAHARSRTGARLPLVVVGRCSPEVRSALRTVRAREGGDPNGLRFVDAPGDREFDDLVALAALTVVLTPGSEARIASAAESLLLGTPAVLPEDGGDPGVAADVASRYPRGDRDALARLFDDACDAATWEKTRAAARRAVGMPSGDAVARRTIDWLAERAAGRPAAPAVGRGARARLALLTPLPPDGSAAAARSAATLEALSLLVDLHLFSDTPGAEPGRTAITVAPVRALASGVQPFDLSLAVLGNSARHAGIFEALLDQGGAALTQDAHLAGFYAETFGPGRTLDLARAEGGAEIAADRVAAWVRRPRDMPILFLSEVARVAEPLLVTSEVARIEAARLYGIDPKRLPLLQHRRFDHDLLRPERRQALREAFGWTPDETVLCSFDTDVAAATVTLWALRLLRDWRVDARLVLCGRLGDEDRAGIDRLARELDLAGAVAAAADGPFGRCRPEHLAAADIAVRLETHPLAGPSDAVLACIAAALPAICNEDAAARAEAPAFVRRVPDALSPLLVAEAALDIVSSGHERTRPVADALAFAAAHAPGRFARAMTEALGLA